jgi:5-methylcytosine-specific restriction endonuclease McrA
MREKANPKSLPDDKLLRGLTESVRQSRRVEADIVAQIAEVDARRLYAREGTPSMFAYCTERLHLSEPETGLRLHVARACRRHPMLLEMLRDGRLHLSGIATLAPHLTPANRKAVLKRAVHRSKRRIEEIVAELSPRPQAPTLVRKVPVPRGGDGPLGLGPGDEGGRATGARSHEHRPDDVGHRSLAEGPGTVNALAPEHRPDDVPAGPMPTPASKIEPVAPACYRVHFNASAELCEKLERLRALKRSSVPDGDLGTIIDQAVTRELDRVEAKRFGKTKTPRKRLGQTDTRAKSRHIPAPVRRFVWKRDGGRCTYRDSRGRRCTKRDDLEFHHRKPFGRGGEHSPNNVVLACGAHNTLMAEQDYGEEKMARFRRAPDRVSELMAVYASSRPRTEARGPGPPASPR